MKTKFTLAMGLLLALSSTAAWAGTDCKDDSRYPEIRLSDLQAKIAAKDVFVVDVNSEKSFKEKHVTSAIHFGTTKDFGKALPADKGKLIVAYCGGPKCTAWKKAAHEACEHGHTNIQHFKGGIMEWKKSGNS